MIFTLSKKQLLILAASLVIHIATVCSILLQQRESIIMPLHNDTMYRAGPGADFYALYHAAINVQRGLSPYDNTLTLDNLVPFYAYRYLPALAYAATPLTLLSPFHAFVLWSLFLELILFALVFLLASRINCSWTFTTASTALLLNSPFFLEVHMGQFTFATTALLLIGIIINHRWLSALFVFLSMFLKPLTIATAPALIKHKRLWPAVMCGVVIAPLLSAPIFLMDLQQWQEFFSTNFHPSAGEGAGNYGMYQMFYLTNQTMNFGLDPGQLTSLFSHYRQILLAGTMVLILISRQQSVLIQASALLLAHFSSYQHTWEHHMSAVIAIAATMLCAKDTHHIFRRLVLLSMVVLALPTPFYIFDHHLFVSDTADNFLGWPTYALYAILLPKVLPCFLLYCLAVWQCVAPHRPPSPD